MKGAAVMFTRKCSKFMQSKQASAFSAAASSSCANLFCMMLGAALLASILFVLLVLRHNTFTIMQYHHLVEHNKRIGDLLGNGKFIVLPPDVLAQLLLQFGHFLHHHQVLCLCAVCSREGQLI